jgi:hypothetical protein
MRVLLLSCWRFGALQHRREGELVGVDLTLLPIEGDSYSIGHANTILRVERCSELHDEILALPSQPVPEQFYTHLGESSGHNTQTDDYDDPLMFVLAGDLKRLREHEGVTQYGNDPVWAYLERLPDKKRIALYWG